MKVEELVALLAEKYDIETSEVRKIVRQLALEYSLTPTKVYRSLHKDVKTGSKSSPTQYLADRYGITETTCTGCFEKMGRKNRPVRCSKCDAELCVECMINNMKAYNVFPVCAIPDCGTTFGKFELHRQLPKSAVESFTPMIKDVNWDKLKARLPEIASIVSLHGFKKMRIKNSARQAAKRLKTFLWITRRELNAIVLPSIKDALEDGNELIVEMEVGKWTTDLIQGTSIITKVQTKYGNGYTIYLSYEARDTLKPLIQKFVGKPKTTSTLTKILACFQEQAKTLWPKIKELQEKIKTEPEFVYRDLKGDIYLEDTRPRNGESVTRSAFVFTCSRMVGEEKCPGFLSTRWKCMLCKEYTCGECHMPKDDDAHECKTENIESAKFIMDHTKPCPKCGARVQRSYGCNHMWCTSCHGGFNYATGAIIPDERNTNPHLHEWKVANGQNTSVRRRPETPETPYACGDDTLPPHSLLIKKCAELKITREDMDTVLDFRNLVDPIEGSRASLRTARDENIMDEDHQLELYIAGLVTEEKMKTFAYKNYRRRERNYHQIAIKETLMVAGRDILSSLLAVDSTEKMKELVDSMWKLREHINVSFRDVSKVLGYQTISYITKELAFVPKVYPKTGGKDNDLDSWIPGRGVCRKENHDDEYYAAGAMYLISKDRLKSLDEAKRDRDRWAARYLTIPVAAQVVSRPVGGSIISPEDFVTEDEWERSGN